MAKADEIQDGDSLVEWIQWRTTHDGVALSQRMAFRVLPLFGAAMREDWARNQGVTVLPLVRFNLSGLATGRANPLALLPSPAPDSKEFRLASNAAVTSADSRLKHVPEATLAAADVAFGSRSDPVKLTNTVADVAVVGARAVENADGLWAQIREDARILDLEEDLSAAKLWTIDTPDWFERADTEMRANWKADPAGRWEFWLRWWEGVLSGQQLSWDLQEKVALIPNEIWAQGVEAVATEIARIEEEFNYHGDGQSELRREIDELPDGAVQNVQRTQMAFIDHRLELPTTFDAVLGFISLEIERLQGRNYRNEDDAAEAKRQIGVLATIYRCVEALKALVPDGPEMDGESGEKAEKLTRLFVRKFKEWPRANSDELVDSTCRAALIGATTLMLPLVGVTTPYAAAAGMVIFGGKKMVDAVKAAKDAGKRQ